MVVTQAQSKTLTQTWMLIMVIMISLKQLLDTKVVFFHF